MRLTRPYEIPPRLVAPEDSVGVVAVSGTEYTIQLTSLPVLVDLTGRLEGASGRWAGRMTLYAYAGDEGPLLDAGDDALANDDYDITAGITENSEGYLVALTFPEPVTGSLRVTTH